MAFIDLFRYSFMLRALAAGSLIAVTCACLGMFLVLRKMSLIGDGLSHVSFGAIALGLFLGIYPFYVAVPVVMAGSLLILIITDKAKVYGDAAIGIVSAVSIAGGVILASASRGFNVDLFSYLFGNILAIGAVEVAVTVVLSAVVLGAVCFFYWDFFSTAFDEEYARTVGTRTGFTNTLLTLLTAVTVVLSVKAVGVLLVSALLILPAVTALQLGRSFRTAIAVAIGAALLSVLIGLPVSFFLNLPAGATIVLVNAFFFSLALLYKKIA